MLQSLHQMIYLCVYTMAPYDNSATINNAIRYRAKYDYTGLVMHTEYAIVLSVSKQHPHVT